MAVKGRLKVNTLQLAGEIKERRPLVNNGLVAYFPFDYNSKGIYNGNLLNYSTWVPGTTGGQTGFTADGTASENRIIWDVDPFGKIIPIWQAEGTDVTSNDDGGFVTPSINIDNTKLYRFSVWVKREVS